LAVSAYRRRHEQRASPSSRYRRSLMYDIAALAVFAAAFALLFGLVWALGRL
jgi:hypothetical protein